MIATQPRAAGRAEATGGSLRVLVVDDNPDDRALVRRALRREYPGLELLEPTDADTFAHMLEAGDYDLVVTDYQLRWTDGLAVLRAVKARWPGCPVVMHTGTGNEEIAVEAMKTGLSDYVLKMRTERLPASVGLALRQARQQRALEEAERARTELLRLEQAARAEAEAAVRVREEFLSIAAHELKTPITVLRSVAEVALRRMNAGGELGPERLLHLLDTVLRQAERLGRLVERLLDTTRIASGLRLERTRTNLADLAEHAVALIQATTDRHVITLRAIPVEAEVDALRVEQALVNLLDNAVKFSPGGGAIDVTLRAVEEAAAEIAVRDHGLGIPVEQRERVFERFSQAHAETHLSGMGLGLFLVRQIVELHGGSIRVEAPPDGGARMVVRLPVRPAESETEAGPPA
jgi:signal transduction histidine kinase